MATTEYKNVGDHVEALAGGRMLGVGEVAELSHDDVKDEYNARLIESGKLIPIKATQKKGDDE